MKDQSICLGEGDISGQYKADIIRCSIEGRGQILVAEVSGEGENHMRGHEQ